MRLDDAALLTFGRARSERHDRDRCHTPLDIADPATDRRVQPIGVQPGQHPLEVPLTGPHETARERIPPPLTGPACPAGPAAHCHIAVTESEPTTSVAHAANARTTTGGAAPP
jgi:hypothetical protein